MLATLRARQRFAVFWSGWCVSASRKSSIAGPAARNASITSFAASARNVFDVGAGRLCRILDALGAGDAVCGNPGFPTGQRGGPIRVFRLSR